MGHRIIVGLKPGAHWPGIKDKLIEVGAQSVSNPSATQPDVLVADIPAAHNVDEFLNRAKSVEGVRYAERDAWSSTL